MRKKIILKLKPTVQKNNRHFVIFEFKYHATKLHDNGHIGMCHEYLLHIYGSYMIVELGVSPTFPTKYELRKQKTGQSLAFKGIDLFFYLPPKK